MRFAKCRAMVRKRTHSAPLALTLDGSLLLNASGRLPTELVLQLAVTLSVAPGDVFVGTRLPLAQRTETLSRLDDAAAEAAARIHGLRAKSSSPGRLRKAYKKV